MSAIRILAERIAALASVEIETEDRGLCSAGDSAVVKEVIARDPSEVGRLVGRVDSLQSQGYRVSRVVYGPAYDLRDDGGRLVTAFPESLLVVLSLGHQGYSTYHPDTGRHSVPAHTPPVGVLVPVADLS